MVMLLLLFIANKTFNDLNLKKYDKMISQDFSHVVVVDKDITLGNYFAFMDSLIHKYDSLTPFTLNEHLIVHRNNWIIDTLENTDYYRRKERNEFIYDFSKLRIIKKKDLIYIPNNTYTNEWQKSQENTIIDINIPEYKLRIKIKDSILYSFPIRVGRDEKKYLAMADRDVDLKTKTGKGKIVRINKKARFINPSDNKEYHVTRRDDNKVTLLPNTPWIEPEINGIRHGQLIHPTTNPKTLGKAYSNGCIGMKEADAWRVYYYAPIGTKIHIRYDLKIKNNNGKEIELKDIYKWRNKVDFDKIAAFLPPREDVSHSICYCK